MSPARQDQELLRARRLLEPMTLGLIKAAAAQRQRAGIGAGARPAASIAAAPVTLEEIAEPRPEGGTERVTPIGYRTASRRLPPVLAALDRSDPRRVVAVRLADAIERVGALKGVDLQKAGGGKGSKGGVSDGGAVQRVQDAELVRHVEAAVNLWDWDPAAKKAKRGRANVILAPSNKRGDRLAIKAYPLICMVCVEARDMRYVLEKHGWSAHSRFRKVLKDKTLELLDITACAIDWRR